MERAQKETAVGSIKEKFDRMTSAVFLDFKGLDVATVSKLRDEFRKSGVEYKVLKNTLIRHAIKQHAWAPKLDESLIGMTGVAFSYDDPSAAAKVVRAFRKDPGHDKLKVKAGLVDGTLVPGDKVESDLASMPGKNELRAMLLATLQAPLQNFVALLNAPAQNFAYLLKAKEDKDGEAAG